MVKDSVGSHSTWISFSFRLYHFLKAPNWFIIHTTPLLFCQKPSSQLFLWKQTRPAFVKEQPDPDE